MYNNMTGGCRTRGYKHDVTAAVVQGLAVSWPCLREKCCNHAIAQGLLFNLQHSRYPHALGASHFYDTQDPAHPGCSEPLAHAKAPKHLCFETWTDAEQGPTCAGLGPSSAVWQKVAREVLRVLEVLRVDPRTRGESACSGPAGSGWELPGCPYKKAQMLIWNQAWWQRASAELWPCMGRLLQYGRRHGHSAERLQDWDVVACTCCIEVDATANGA